MQIQYTFIFGLIASSLAFSVPTSTSSEIVQRDVYDDASYEPHMLEARAGKKLSDYRCPQTQRVTIAQIRNAMQAENARANPRVYGNRETGGPLFQVGAGTTLFEARINNIVRAVFSRNAQGGFVFRGVMEHPPGLSNAFRICAPIRNTQEGGNNNNNATPTPTPGANATPTPDARNTPAPDPNNSGTPDPNRPPQNDPNVPPANNPAPPANNPPAPAPALAPAPGGGRGRGRGRRPALL